MLDGIVLVDERGICEEGLTGDTLRGGHDGSLEGTRAWCWTLVGDNTGDTGLDHLLSLECTCLREGMGDQMQ